MLTSRDIPSNVRRQLRQEANFGCAICGCPIIEIHHIIPWHVKPQNDPQDMIVLCPTHHARADAGEYSEEYLRHVKKAPHNSILVKDAFVVNSSELIVNFAGNVFVNTPTILEVDGFEIISISKQGPYPTLNVNFFDSLNRWIAIINENFWYADRTLLWDVEYKPKHLIVRCKPRQISLEVEIKKDEVFIRGEFYYNRYKILATSDSLFLGEKKMVTMKGCRIESCRVGVSIHTF